MLDLLIENIKNWGLDKGITGPNGKATAITQHLKTCEEVTELGDAIADNNRAEIVDAIGDITVTLILQCELQGLNFDECLLSAYNVIKNRQGRMINGQFVKNS